MSFQNIITNLKEHNTLNTVQIWVPSLGRSVHFTPLTITQQTDIISAIGFDGVVSPLTITRAINQIVMDNCIEDNIEFKVYDKYHVLLGLRIAAMGDKVENEPTTTLSVPKTKMLEDLATIVDEDIEVKCVIPTLSDENKLVTKLITEIKNNNIKDSGELVNLLYIGEIIKFISEVTVGSETVVFNDIQYKDRKEVVKNLPLTINNKVIKLIQDIRTVESECLVIGDKKLTIDQLFVTK